MHRHTPNLYVVEVRHNYEQRVFYAPVAQQFGPLLLGFWQGNLVIIHPSLHRHHIACEMVMV